MQWRRVLAAALVAGLVAGGGMIAQAGGGVDTPTPAQHWAKPTVEQAAALGFWPWPDASGSTLNDPITPTEWDALVAALLNTAPGPGGDSLSQSVWTWTVEAANRQTQITRQQAVNGLVWMLRSYGGLALGADPAVTLAGFRDATQVGRTEEMQVAAAVHEGWLVGWNGLIRPADPLTRAEAATLVVRLQERYGSILTARQAMARIIGRAPLGFGQGLDRPVNLEPAFLLSGTPGIATGDLAALVDGAALTAEVAGLKAPEGSHWLVLDVTMAADNGPVPLMDRVTITIEDGPMSIRYPLDAAATALLDPTLLNAQLAPGEAVRGLAVFAVPTDARGLWFNITHRMAATPAKPEAGGAMRGQLGEPVPAEGAHLR